MKTEKYHRLFLCTAKKGGKRVREIGREKEGEKEREKREHNYLQDTRRLEDRKMSPLIFLHSRFEL